MLPSGAKAPLPSGGVGLLDRERFSAGNASRIQGAGVAFAAYCRKHADVTDPYLLPPHALEDLLYRFAQHCYKAGRKGGYAQALHAALDAQVRRPRLKRRLQTVWSALWNWKLERPLHMRLPLPRPGLDAPFAQAILNGFVLDTPRTHLWIPVAVFLRLGFFGLLRPGEFTNLVRRQLVLPSQNYLGFGEQLVFAFESRSGRVAEVGLRAVLRRVLQRRLRGHGPFFFAGAVEAHLRAVLQGGKCGRGARRPHPRRRFGAPAQDERA